MNKIINKKTAAILLAVMMITAFAFASPEATFASETQQSTPAYSSQDTVANGEEINSIEPTLPDGSIVVTKPQTTTPPQLEDGVDAAEPSLTEIEDPNAQTVTPDNYGTVFDGEFGIGDIEDIEEYWHENGYPDYISYASQAGAEKLSATEVIFKYEIGVVGMTEEIKAEILNLVGSNCTVEFVQCEYNYNQRNHAKEEILSWNDENIADVFLSRNTELVYVDFANEITDEQLAEYNRTFQKEFADMVEVIDTITTITYDDVYGAELSPGIGAGNKANNNSFYIAISLLLVAILGIFLYNKSRNAKILALSNGEIKTESKISKFQVKSAIKNQNIEPSDDVLDKILLDIDK